MKVIYLHGFSSSGRAEKASLLAREFANKPEISFISPDLSYEPKKAVSQIAQLIHSVNHVDDHSEPLVFIGSSLGGFYAQYFSGQYLSAKIILINPVINVNGLLTNYYGRHQNPYTGEIIEISDSFVSELEKYMLTEVHNPERFLLLLQTDDEVLDYQQALNKFPDSPKTIRTGGGHLFNDFESVIPDILSFMINNQE